MALQKTVLPILRSNRSCAPDFEQVLKENRWEGLTRDEVKTLQINVGKFCNQACHHCHVEAGPKRTEIMPPEDTWRNSSRTMKWKSSPVFRAIPRRTWISSEVAGFLKRASMHSKS